MSELNSSDEDIPYNYIVDNSRDIPERENLESKSLNFKEVHNSPYITDDSEEDRDDYNTYSDDRASILYKEKPWNESRNLKYFDYNAKRKRSTEDVDNSRRYNIREDSSSCDISSDDKYSSENNSITDESNTSDSSIGSFLSFINIIFNNHMISVDLLYIGVADIMINFKLSLYRIAYSIYFNIFSVFDSVSLRIL